MFQRTDRGDRTEGQPVYGWGASRLRGAIGSVALILCTSLPATAVTVGNHTLTFDGVRYNFPQANQSTWYWTLQTGTGGGPKQALSHSAFALPLACAEVVGGAAGAGHWGPTQNDLQPGAGRPVIGRDPTTEIDGLKFDESVPNGRTLRYYVTLDANYLVGSILAATKSGIYVSVVDIPGPSLTCEVNVLPCGNGTLEPGEQCDDGTLNSDTESDACR